MGRSYAYTPRITLCIFPDNPRTTRHPTDSACQNVSRPEQLGSQCFCQRDFLPKVTMNQIYGQNFFTESNDLKTRLYTKYGGRYQYLDDRSPNCLHKWCSKHHYTIVFAECILYGGTDKTGSPVYKISFIDLWRLFIQSLICYHWRKVPTSNSRIFPFSRVGDLKPETPQSISSHFSKQFLQYNSHKTPCRFWMVATKFDASNGCCNFRYPTRQTLVQRVAHLKIRLPNTNLFKRRFSCSPLAEG